MNTNMTGLRSGGFQTSLSPYALDESSFSIERVNIGIDRKENDKHKHILFGVEAYSLITIIRPTLTVYAITS